MKSGLYFILGVIFTLLIYSAENQNKNESFNTNTFQTVTLQNNTDCIIASFKFSIESVLNEISLFRLYNENERYSANLKKNNPIQSLSHLFKRRNYKIKNLKNIPFKLIFYFSADKDDHHNLS